jgi:hypothetical protein
LLLLCSAVLLVAVLCCVVDVRSANTSREQHVGLR